MYPRIYFIRYDIDLTTIYSRCVYLFLTVYIIFTCNIVCTLALTHQVNKSIKMLTFSNLLEEKCRQVYLKTSTYKDKIFNGILFL